jgi:hypothetical protein
MRGRGAGATPSEAYIYIGRGPSLGGDTQQNRQNHRPTEGANGAGQGPARELAFAIRCQVVPYPPMLDVTEDDE